MNQVCGADPRCLAAPQGARRRARAEAGSACAWSPCWPSCSICSGRGGMPGRVRVIPTMTGLSRTHSVGSG